MLSDRWSFEKVGLGYRCWSDEIQTEFRLTRLKRSHGDLTGELKITTNIKDVKTNNGVLLVTRLNVFSSTSKASLAKMLEKRTPGQDMDWFDGIEWLCQHVILAEQQGEPVIELGDHAGPRAARQVPRRTTRRSRACPRCCSGQAVSARA